MLAQRCCQVSPAVAPLETQEPLAPATRNLPSWSGDETICHGPPGNLHVQISGRTMANGLIAAPRGEVPCRRSKGFLSFKRCHCGRNLTASLCKHRPGSCTWLVHVLGALTAPRPLCPSGS